MAKFSGRIVVLPRIIATVIRLAILFSRCLFILIEHLAHRLGHPGGPIQIAAIPEDIYLHLQGVVVEVHIVPLRYLVILEQLIEAHFYFLD